MFKLAFFIFHIKLTLHVYEPIFSSGGGGGGGVVTARETAANQGTTVRPATT